MRVLTKHEFRILVVSPQVELHCNSRKKQNNATKEELMTLTGVGESKAIAIIEYRSKNKFNTIEDIMNVSGIGESAFAKIKEYITVQ